MILDNQLVLAWKQAVTVAAASAATNNTNGTYNAVGIIDMSKARNIGVGTTKLYLVVDCATTMADTNNDATLTPSLRTSATQSGSALTGTINTLMTGSAFAALSPAGTRQVYVLPPAAYLEFIDVYFTPANGSLTAGSFSAYITTDVDQQTYYAEGFNPQ
jgi:hypothetical protein